MIRLGGIQADDDLQRAPTCKKAHTGQGQRALTSSTLVVDGCLKLSFIQLSNVVDADLRDMQSARICNSALSSGLSCSVKCSHEFSIFINCISCPGW